MKASFSRIKEKLEKTEIGLIFNSFIIISCNLLVFLTINSESVR